MGLSLGSDRLGDQSLARSWRTVQQNPAWWVDSEAAEQHWVLERKFDHFTDFLQLLADATYVLVGDARDLGVLFLIHSLFLDDDLSIGKNLDDALRARLDDLEGQCLSEESHPWNEDAVARHNWALVETAAGKTLDAWPEANLLLLGHHRTENQSSAGLRLDFLDHDAISKRDARVLADNPINADNAEIGILGPTAPDDCSCRTLTSNLDDVARFEVQFIVEGHPRPTVTDIARDGLRHPQLEFLG